MKILNSYLGKPLLLEIPTYIIQHMRIYEVQKELMNNTHPIINSNNPTIPQIISPYLKKSKCTLGPHLEFNCHKLHKTKEETTYIMQHATIHKIYILLWQCTHTHTNNLTTTIQYYSPNSVIISIRNKIFNPFGNSMHF